MFVCDKIGGRNSRKLHIWKISARTYVIYQEEDKYEKERTICNLVHVLLRT